MKPGGGGNMAQPIPTMNNMNRFGANPGMMGEGFNNMDVFQQPQPPMNPRTSYGRTSDMGGN